MNILALVTDAFGGYGGIAQYNRDFLSALALSERVESITILPRLVSGPLESHHPKIVQLGAVFGKVSYAASAFEIARRQRPDVIFNGHLFHGPLALRLAQLFGAKLLSQLHGTEIWSPIASRHSRPLECSDLVLTVSRDTRARLVSYAKIVPERAVVLNNTVGDDFEPGDRAAARGRLRLEQTDLVVLTVARLVSREGYKGHDRVIPLISALRAGGLPLVYLIAGVGDDSPRLEALAKSHGVAGHVRFLGKVPRRDLPDLYRAANLFALPSGGEGFGIAFLEAMACGVPAIGLALGGAPDALADGELGYCARECDFPDVFRQALQAAAPEPGKLAGAVQARFGTPVFNDRVSQIFQTLQ